MARAPAPGGADLLQLFGPADDRRHLDRGEYLFRLHDPTWACFALEHGRLRLLRAQPDGAELTVHRVFAGASFAEASLFADRYSCDCRADTACTVAVFDRTRLRRRLASDPGLALAWAERLAHRVKQQRSLLEIRSIHNAYERLQTYLEWRAGPGRRPVPISSLRALASELGLAEETVYRQVRRLETDGRVRRGNGELHLL